jgi:hypothetical protein
VKFSNYELPTDLKSKLKRFFKDELEDTMSGGGDSDGSILCGV